jgi:hypothetical protein
VFNLKLSVIAAGAAFVLSFVIGIVSGAEFLYILLRALFSGIVFFSLSVFAYWAISQFIPELLDVAKSSDAPLDGDDDTPLPGSNINISVGPDGEDAEADELPPLDRLGGGGEGDFSRPETGIGPREAPEGQKTGNTPENQGLDQTTQNEYTKDTSGVSGAVAVPAGADIDTVDALPDLEVLSTIFAPQEDDEDPAEDAAFVPSEPGETLGAIAGGGDLGKKKSSSAQSDFNVKEMASAIQTILKRDEKG